MHHNVFECIFLLHFLLQLTKALYARTYSNFLYEWNPHSLFQIAESLTKQVVLHSIPNLIVAKRNICRWLPFFSEKSIQRVCFKGYCCCRVIIGNQAQGRFPFILYNYVQLFSSVWIDIQD